MSRRSGLGRWLAFAVALLAGAPAIAASQSPAAQQPTAWSLFTVRYDTRTSNFIYALYGYGSTFAMVGVLHNPRSDWSELLGAVGRNFSMGRLGTSAAAVGLAQTADQWYAQAYYVPDVRIGIVAVRATAEWDVPVNRGGLMQFAFSPLSVTVPTLHGIEAGIATDVAASRSERTSIAIGPELRVPLPHAVLGIDGERMLHESASRLRVFFTTSF